MSTKTIKVEITGVSPLLMHRYPLIPVDGIDKKSPQEQAEHAAYRGLDGFLGVPGMNLWRSLVSAATYSKGKGRSSQVRAAAACLLVEPQWLTLNTKEFAIDSQRCVIPATRGTVVRHRPRLNTWKLEFELSYDETLLKATEIRKIVDDAGERVGLLDFRPEKRGPFGRFMVTEWKD